MYPPNLHEFFPEYTDEEAVEMLNTLPLDLVDFSRRTDLFELMFGVKTGSYRSSYYLNEPEASDHIVANSCIRQSLLDLLVSITSETEKFVGFLMRDRYVTQEVPVVFGKKNETTFAGVETMNVIREWAAIENLSDQSVSYKAIETPTTEEIDSVWYVRMPVSIIPNPKNTWVRRDSDDGTYSVPSTPAIQRVSDPGGDYWRVPIGTGDNPYPGGTAIYVQDRQYVYVDITHPAASTLEDGATIAPVYSGTNLMIPLARPTESLGSDVYRYWFYVYTLVSPDMYFDREINLREAPVDIWKMVPVIDFKQWYETSAPIEVTVYQGDQSDVYTFDPLDEDNPTINAELVSQELGVYHFSIDPCFSIETHCGYTPTSITAKIYYKVSPTVLGVQYRRQINRIIQAMSYRVGAEVPIISCDCFIHSGFIAEQRRETGTVHRNLFTNVDKFTVGYANRIGIDAYHDIMSTMVISRTLVPKI